MVTPMPDGVTRKSPLDTGVSPKFGGQNKICKSIQNLVVLCNPGYSQFWELQITVELPITALVHSSTIL